jgi:ABC-type transport system involved in cytochrome bd biosynthesis fused ATPase/permease subunit
MEPLGAPQHSSAGPSGADEPQARPGVSAHGVSLSLRHVAVALGGRVVLDDLELEIAPGEHIAVIGPSGAGKSTLAGLVLGFHPAAAGEFLVDGERATLRKIESIRLHTAWIDPAVQLWNRSLFENLRYGSDETSTDGLGALLDASGLRPLIQKLPDGLQQPLGENGRLVSGGEGQRVRFGRGLFRTDVRLAILDEPFRGLDGPSRRQLLGAARAHWSDATIVWITHDVADTRELDRVVILEDGRIVEAGVPATLAAQADSRYARLLAADEIDRREAWQSGWTRVRLVQGRLCAADEELE